MELLPPAAAHPPARSRGRGRPKGRGAGAVQRGVPHQASSPAGARRLGPDRPTNRRARPRRRRVRGLPPGDARRLPDHRPGSRHLYGGRAAHRRDHLEPDARNTRCAEAPLPLLLDRLPGPPEGDADRAQQGPRGRAEAGGAGHRLRPGAAGHGAVQGARRRRDARLDGGPGEPERARAQSVGHRRHARRHAQVPRGRPGGARASRPGRS